jgi:type VI secretion system ImpB/VipA family protein
MSAKKPEARVHITYEDVSSGQPREVELKNRVLVLAALTGHGETDLAGSPVEVTKTNFARLAGLRPVLDLEVPNRLTGDGAARFSARLEFDRAPDQWPAVVVAQVPALRELARLREGLLALKTRLKTNPALRRQLEELLGRAPERLLELLAALSGPAPALAHQPEARSETEKPEEE